MNNLIDVKNEEDKIRIRKQSDKLRHDAKKGMLRLFNISDSHSNGTAEMIIDNIISVAILEIELKLNEQEQCPTTRRPPTTLKR